MAGILLVCLLGFLPLVQGSGMCTNDITSTLVTVSSQMAPTDKMRNHGPDRSAINTTEIVDANGVTQMGSWVAEKNTFNEWIQIELKDVSLIRGLMTQGRNGCCKDWVTKYRVLYSEDCKNWTTVGGFNVTDAFFKGNTDQDTPVTNLFHCPVMAKCIRINPLGWNKDIAMRVGLLGCGINLNLTSASTTSTSSAATASTTPAAATSTPPAATTSATPTVSASTAPTSSASTTLTTQSVQSTSTAQKSTSSMLSQNPASTSSKATTTAQPAPTQKSGGTAKCVKSCKGMPNGDYQSCAGCDVYMTCNWGLDNDKRPCPKGLKWDNKLKRCDFTSSTCP